MKRTIVLLLAVIGLFGCATGPPLPEGETIIVASPSAPITTSHKYFLEGFDSGLEDAWIQEHGAKPGSAIVVTSDFVYYITAPDTGDHTADQAYTFVELLRLPRNESSDDMFLTMSFVRQQIEGYEFSILGCWIVPKTKIDLEGRAEIRVGDSYSEIAPLGRSDKGTGSTFDESFHIIVWDSLRARVAQRIENAPVSIHLYRKNGFFDIDVPRYFIDLCRTLYDRP